MTTDPKFEQEARKLNEQLRAEFNSQPRLRTSVAGVEYEFGQFLVAKLAAKIQRVAELEKAVEASLSERESSRILMARIEELKNNAATREKEFEAILVEKNERIKEAQEQLRLCFIENKNLISQNLEMDSIAVGLQNQLSEIRGKMQGMLDEYVLDTPRADEARVVLRNCLSFFAAPNSQQTERSEG